MYDRKKLLSDGGCSSLVAFFGEMFMNIEVGKIVNTHGLKGEIKLVSWCDFPEMFDCFPDISVNGKKYDVDYVKYHKDSVILKLSGVDSIDAAEELKNTVAFADREYFDLPEDRYFIADLIGLSVFCDGEKIGEIKEVIPTGSTGVYAVSRKGKQELLIPANETTIIETNINEGYVKMRIPEGLEEI